MNPRIQIVSTEEGFIWEVVDDEGRTLARSAMVYQDLGRCEGHAWRVIEMCRDPSISVAGPDPQT